MPRTSVALLIAAFLLVAPVAAQAAGVSALIGLDSHGVSRVPDFTLDEPGRKAGFASGVQVDFAVLGPVSLELGAMVVGTGYKLTDRAGAGFVEYSGTQVQFPIQARVEPFALVSVGAGIYFAKGVGDLECVSSGAVTCLAQGSYQDYNLKPTDFGWMASVGSRFGLGVISVMVDLRYLKGLSNQLQDTSTGVSEFKQNDLQFLAGVRLGI